MSYSLDLSIREQLASYLAGKISLRQFEDWFFPETWDVDQFANLFLISLVYGIKLRFAEYSHGDWTEDELRRLLRPFVEKYDMSVASTPAQSQIQLGTSSLSSRITYSVQSADTKSSMVSA